MVRGHKAQDLETDQAVSWNSLRTLLPYLLEFKGRIGLALLCLVAAKFASVGLPFVLKNIVDQLNLPTGIDQIVVVPILLSPSWPA